MLDNSMSLKPIGHIKTDFPTKFGIPRQSMQVDKLCGKIIFEPEFRIVEAFRGLDGFSHIWLIWQFSESIRDEWAPTVRPPRLGGNKRMGVFATRSPFRPNALGLSCVKLEKIDLHTKDGPVLTVSGIDMMNNTPIFDIKPYLPHADCIKDASGGFSTPVADEKIEVVFTKNVIAALPESMLQPLTALLEQDPRPHYQNDPERIYGFPFADYEIQFRVHEKTLFVINAECKK